MDALNGAARKPFFHVQVKPDEGKRQLDRLGGVPAVLCRESIDDVLVNESDIAERERVAAELFVRRLVWRPDHFVTRFVRAGEVVIGPRTAGVASLSR